jgi:hypothetical protein
MLRYNEVLKKFDQEQRVSYAAAEKVGYLPNSYI